MVLSIDHFPPPFINKNMDDNNIAQSVLLSCNKFQNPVAMNSFYFVVDSAINMI